MSSCSLPSRHSSLDWQAARRLRRRQFILRHVLYSSGRFARFCQLQELGLYRLLQAIHAHLPCTTLLNSEDLCIIGEEDKFKIVWKSVPSRLAKYCAAIDTVWTENWHTSHSCPEERLYQLYYFDFCSFSLSSLDPIRTDGRTDGGAGKTRNAVYYDGYNHSIKPGFLKWPKLYKLLLDPLESGQVKSSPANMSFSCSCIYRVDNNRC